MSYRPLPTPADLDWSHAWHGDRTGPQVAYVIARAITDAGAADD